MNKNSCARRTLFSTLEKLNFFLEAEQSVGRRPLVCWVNLNRCLLCSQALVFCQISPIDLDVSCLMIFVPTDNKMVLYKVLWLNLNCFLLFAFASLIIFEQGSHFFPFVNWTLDSPNWPSLLIRLVLVSCWFWQPLHQIEEKSLFSTVWLVDRLKWRLSYQGQWTL